MRRILRANMNVLTYFCVGFVENDSLNYYCKPLGKKLPCAPDKFCFFEGNCVPDRSVTVTAYARVARGERVGA